MSSSKNSLFTEQSSKFIKRQPAWRLKGIEFIQSTNYRIAVISFNIISITQFIWLLLIMTKSEFLAFSKKWIVYALIINTVFLLDLIVHFVMFGFVRILKKKTEYLCEFLL